MRSSSIEKIEKINFRLGFLGLDIGFAQFINQFRLRWGDGLYA